jgi:hypothetical protein
MLALEEVARPYFSDSFPHGVICVQHIGFHNVL